MGFVVESIFYAKWNTPISSFVELLEILGVTCYLNINISFNVNNK